MEFTQEQLDIIRSTGNIKINAVAGSGKTTTIIEYAATRPPKSHILYLAFNKSVKLEAAKKFAQQGLKNVTVETAHSLAFKHIVYNSTFKVRPQGYKTTEIVDLLQIKNKGEKHAEYVMANHINKLVAYFCNSDKQKVHELNYLDTIDDETAYDFVVSQYDDIISLTRQFLAKMMKGEIEITHDFYLKLFQLSNPKLHYDYILFDEGQDASAAMLDVFLKQDAVKVIVGDTHQQIYGWRYAVNSLEKVSFKTYHLSSSFRFSQNMANLAMKVLNLKKYIDLYQPIAIKGKGSSHSTKTTAVIARTNLGLLLKAIAYVTDRKQIKSIYFEGNIHSYTYAEDGASLYDVLNLYQGNRTHIKDKMIKSMKDLVELEDYIEKTEDVQLGMMVEIVKEYGHKIPEILKAIKAKHVGDEDKEKADMIFSTVHRCKGMEYDVIHLVDDFITREKLERLVEDKEEKTIPYTRLNEEINLLYVALTRAKQHIYIPEALMPFGFPVSAEIHVVKEVNKGEKDPRKNASSNQKIEDKWGKTEKAYSVDEVRTKHAGAYSTWTADLDQELIELFCKGVSVSDMADYFGRTKGAIMSRIKKLELYDLYG